MYEKKDKERQAKGEEEREREGGRGVGGFRVRRVEARPDGEKHGTHS